MAAARLHYLSHDIAVPLGPFVIGRGADCQLALDDPLVSRRHASIRVEIDGATLEDLGSRNGVLLNGVRIEKPERLHDGDVVRVGSQDISFYADNNPISSRRAAHVTQRNMQLTQVGDRPLLPLTPLIQAGDRPSVPRAISAEDELLEDNEGEPTFVATSPMSVPGPSNSGLAIIGSVADKALQMGRVDEAERILQRSLIDVLARAQKGTGGIDAVVAERAAAYALRLATATGRGTWVDYIFQLYTAVSLVMPGKVVDELYAAVRKVKATDKSVLRGYCTRLRDMSASFGPAERFVLQRIESLERWAP